MYGYQIVRRVDNTHFMGVKIKTALFKLLVSEIQAKYPQRDYQIAKIDGYWELIVSNEKAAV